MYVKDELYVYTVVECSLLIMGGKGVLDWFVR